MKPKPARFNPRLCAPDFWWHRQHGKIRWREKEDGSWFASNDYFRVYFAPGARLSRENPAKHRPTEIKRRPPTDKRRATERDGLQVVIEEVLIRAPDGRTIHEMRAAGDSEHKIAAAIATPDDDPETVRKRIVRNRARMKRHEAHENISTGKKR